MFGMWDRTFCANRECPNAKGKRGCGRSITNFDGHSLILYISGYKPDETGHCGMYMEPMDWEPLIEPWMEDRGSRLAKDQEVQEAFDLEALDADSLAADSLDKEF